MRDKRTGPPPAHGDAASPDAVHARAARPAARCGQRGGDAGAAAGRGHRIEPTNAALAGRLKGMSPQELMKYLLKDLVRPQAMLPRQLKITPRNIEVP
ncbi:hypothetical protein A6P39_020715 [Streptomyces sp. FXJ1.172]|uniref:hypothetical protein n=1 Tax=Streptomyces sp. FXJ1.172 TaxID=710705 RepID=UPI000ADF9A39|nr:hypothetical protein [Streptomyces sp. FXJ1.172]WEO96257.1 hypothetical protein A6P39_020715 [Streptomyces sp. FXJ1.172]